MKTGLADYVAEAFSARPLGMPIPPNWIGLVAFGLLGLLNPGFWLVGAGLELAYLLGLAHWPRFRAVIDANRMAVANASGKARTEATLAGLDEARRARFLKLQARCDAILREQRADSTILEMQRQGLDRLLAIHLHLLVTQRTMERLIRESDVSVESLDERIAGLHERLGGGGLAEEFHRSLEGQLEIFERRKQALIEGGERLAFSDAELVRIEQQIALLGDEVRLSRTPETIGSQIDRVSDELDETRRWIQEQERIFGSDPEAAPFNPQTQ